MVICDWATQTKVPLPYSPPIITACFVSDFPGLRVNTTEKYIVKTFRSGPVFLIEPKSSESLSN